MYSNTYCGLTVWHMHLPISHLLASALDCLLTSISRKHVRVCFGSISCTYLRAHILDFETPFDLSPKRIMGPFYLDSFSWTIAVSVPSRSSRLLTFASTGAGTPQRLTVWL